MSQGLHIRRAKRGDLAAIVDLADKASQSQAQVDEAEVMEWLFSKGMMVAAQADSLAGVAAWQTENLVSVTDLFFVWPLSALADAGSGLLTAIESELETLMCEANIVLLPTWASEELLDCLRQQGYEAKEFDELHRIWREVLGEFIADDTELMVKRLRERMVMAPL